MQDKPKISIISPSKNTGRFAKETLESILSQIYKNWEHIVVDGMSTDETLDVIRQYPYIRWISEEDSGPDEAFRKGLAMAKGEYVMLCCISDGYLDKNWFKKCVEILDHQPEISLVWGFPQYMSEDGVLGRIAYDYFFDDHPSHGKDFIYYWLKTHFHFTEGNFCVRKNVMDDCFPVVDPKKVGEESEFLSFNYKFNTRGYLPYFIPEVANYGRIHYDAGGQKQIASGQMQLWAERYHNDIEKYKEQLIKGKMAHQYRDGLGNLLPEGFDIKKYQSFKINPTHNKRPSYIWKVKTRLKRILA
ncbi:MAG: glycosyltransferase [Proteobacteria bacterium]|nr:glycosyltransferase [Pseudomonadota bacterium]